MAPLLFTHVKAAEGIKPDNSKGIPYKIVIGYTAQKEFYSPNYDTYDVRNEEKDIRTTLYWAPTIINKSRTTIPFGSNFIIMISHTAFV